MGPKRVVKTYPIYFVNGYKFNTKEYGAEKLTNNTGVFVKGSDDPENHLNDFYGVLTQILQLTYFSRPAEEVFLFRCNWFSNVPGSGINVHKDYNLIEIKHTSHYHKYDPFVLAKQALQVYYAPYPSLKEIKQIDLQFLKQKPDSHSMRRIFRTNKLIRQILSKITK